jgi:hypothetical protein
MASQMVIGLPKVLANLSDLGKNQIPFAVSLMLNATARDIQAAERSGIDEAFDKPKPFTRNAFGLVYSNKQNLTAKVFAKDIQAKYLLPQVEGGPREFKTFEERFAATGGPKVALPGQAAKLDQFGNISKAQIKKIAKDLNTAGTAKRFFNGVPKGGKLPAGIYTRVNNNTSIAPLIVFGNDAVYEKRFRFSEIAGATVDASYEKNMRAAWERTIKSAKR